MKRLIQIIIFLGVIILNFHSCEKWDLNKKNFVSVNTGFLLENSITTATIQSEIIGFEQGKLLEHGHLYSCVNPQLEFGQLDVESSSLGITFDGGKFTNTLENLTLNATYYVRAFVLVEGDIEPIYGEVIEVSLGENELVVETESVDFFVGGFEMYGRISDLQSDVEISKYGFVLSTENEIPIIAEDEGENEVFYLGLLNSNQTFKKKLDNVEPLKTYYYRAFAQLGKETFYGEPKSFFKGDVWTRKSDAPNSRTGGYAGGVANAGYIGGGETFNPMSLQKFDPELDSWENQSPLDGVYTFFGASFTIDNILYTVTGADNIGNDLWAYNTINDSWSQKSPFPGPSMFFTTVAATVQGKGYIGMGTSPITGAVYDGIWEYDPSTDSWVALSSQPFSEERLAAFVFSHEDELIVGYGEIGSYLDLWVYNVTSQLWTQRDFTALPELFPTGFTSFSIGDKGYYIATTLRENNVYEYDMNDNSWELRADYPGLQRGDPMSFTVNGKAYVGMGLDINAQEIVSDLWEYTPNIE